MIYLDNAATSYPKPMSLFSALLDTQVRPLGNPSRGAHAASLWASEVVFGLREGLSSFFGVGDETRVVFTQNATHALNLALFGLLGDRTDCPAVLTSALEHNSVLRPLYCLEERGKIRLHFFEPSVDEEECLRRFRSALAQDPPYLAAVSACANTTGLCPPLRELCAEAHRVGTLVLLDGSQAAGHREMDLGVIGADYLCVPAHKGLYGLTGGGALMLVPGAPVPSPILFGGAGFESEKREMPQVLPERLEAGTLPVHTLCAWQAGLDFVRSRTVQEIGRRECALADALREELCRMGYELYSPRASSLVLFNAPGLSSEELAQRLSDEDICVRGGLHCAPRAHEMLGTLGRGAVRASFGAFNDEGDVERTLAVLHGIARDFV